MAQTHGVVAIDQNAEAPHSFQRAFRHATLLPCGVSASRFPATIACSDGDKKQLFDLMNIFATSRNLAYCRMWRSFTPGALCANLSGPAIREHFDALFNRFAGSGRGEWKKQFLAMFGDFPANSRSP
jgi:hypothetical protein|tara:strand:- start:187 stop:567 length:381 start_codon:yes stop_codon:yes gene_type:complete